MGVTRILIANRGEIAVRIAATARRMGIETVAVHSDADENALHTRAADEAVRIGPAPASESYLDQEAILRAARDAGADAVHPGYGFLSENADFAQACVDAGLVFIGPSPEVIRAMGDKGEAKARMAAASVPVVPGWQGAEQSPEALRREAERIGFPLLIKAVAGGGGRGMRQVDKAAEFGGALASAVREAQNAFGDGRVLLEKLVADGAHVEVQIFGDAHGTIVHLFERDCSAQRRRQKIVEEAPSPRVTRELRKRMGADAVAAAKAVGYVGAGTVEFLLDGQGNYYFLEMNTRLQVEHPVTEMITGLDLVEWQIRVARGEALPLRQDAIPMNGHAVEARLYAEDPNRGFAPETGRVAWFAAAEGDGLRFDMGVATGSAVTPYYDNMLGKLIAHGETRDEAIARLVGGLEASPLLGVGTNQGFLIDLLQSTEFRGGKVTTATLDAWEQAGMRYLAKPAVDERAWDLAALLVTERSGGDWFTTSGYVAFDLTLETGGEARTFRVRRERTGTVFVNERPLKLLKADPARICYRVDGNEHPGIRAWDADTLHLWWAGRALAFREPDIFGSGADAAGSNVVAAPFAGLVVSVAVAEGQRVAAGETLAVVEAMKMEMKLGAANGGVVTAVHVRAGDQVAAGAVVAEIAVED